MIKKLSAIFLTAAVLLSLCACGAKEDGNKNLTETSQVTEKPVPTAKEGATGLESQGALNIIYYLPDYKFKEIIEEDYFDYKNEYNLLANCSEAEYKDYVAKCGEAGFTDRLDTGKDPFLFDAVNSKNAEVYVSYSKEKSEISVIAYFR